MSRRQISRRPEYTALVESGQPTFAETREAPAEYLKPRKSPPNRPYAPDKIVLATFCYVGQVRWSKMRGMHRKFLAASVPKAESQEGVLG
jgi:hypothetical protein